MEEAPEVRFDDVMQAVVQTADTRLTIDPRFLEVCELGSVLVCSCVPHIPVLVGAAVEGKIVRIRLADTSQPVRVIVRLTGIRKGFRGLRFPDRTREQFEDNERFIKSAYKHD